MKTLQNFLGVLLFTLGAINLSSCSEKNDVPVPPAPTPVAWASVTASPDTWDNQKRGNISYQALVYSFADADGDKYGDLRGLTEKLDYLDALGVQAVWLSPIHPSPSYHGYDVKDYDAIDTRFGTMNDFKTLVAEAKKTRYQDLSGLCAQPHQHGTPLVQRGSCVCDFAVQTVLFFFERPEKGYCRRKNRHDSYAGSERLCGKRVVRVYRQQ